MTNNAVGSYAIRTAIAARTSTQSQRALARDLGLGNGGQALLSKILRGVSVSPATMQRIGYALGIAPPPPIEIPPCPDCGGAHYGRCHNKPVAVRPVRPPRPITRWADAPTRTLAQAIAHRIEI
jgi:transcriptional regulator with XRE-family HTH domain